MHIYLNNKKLQKKFIRTYIRTIRHNTTLQEKNVAALLITNKIIIMDHIQKSTHIGIYLSFDSEIHTNSLIKTLLFMKKNIYLPIVPKSNTQCLLFHKYTLSTPLIRNRFNIFEPIIKTTAFISTKLLDIVFIPLVAFDQTGHRLGMGGGFYDRMLNQCLQDKSSYITIGLAYDFQKIPHQLFPIEPWDIKLSEIVTPSHHWRW